MIERSPKRIDHIFRIISKNYPLFQRENHPSYQLSYVCENSLRHIQAKVGLNEDEEIFICLK